MRSQLPKLLALCLPLFAGALGACSDDDDFEVVPDAAPADAFVPAPTPADAGGCVGAACTPDAGVVPDALAADAGAVNDAGAGVSQGRLLVADGDPEKPRFWVVDLDDGSTVASFAALGSARVYSTESGSGYAWVNQRVPGLVEIVASGISVQEGMLTKVSPWVLDTRLEGPLPTHWVSHDHWIVSFNDGDGSFDYVLESSLGTTRPLMRRATTGKAHHGVALISQGNVFASLPNPDPAAMSTLPVGVTIRKLATPDVVFEQSDACPALHGEGSNDEVVAFGCGDGVLIAERKEGKFAFRKLPNPADTPMGRRVGTVKAKDGVPRLVGNWGNGFALIPYRDATPVWTAVDLGAANRGFDVDESGQRLVVLAGDGTLRMYNPITGAALGPPLAVMDAWPTMGLPPGTPTPGMGLGKDKAFITDPRVGTVVEVDLATWQKGRTFTVGGQPYSVAAFGRWMPSPQP